MKTLRPIFNKSRAKFPALARKHEDEQAIFFDGPAGTQVPRSVIEAISDYLSTCNANHGGMFATSTESDQQTESAHQAFADFLGASDPHEVIFGQNMTSLTFAMSRALSQTWTDGDEIIVTRLDHDANVTPWVLAARDRGVTVNYAKFRDDDFTLDVDDLLGKLSDKTKLVAVGCASNATGGVNPVEQICGAARDVGALSFLDAVHYGPHDLIDVKKFGCDFLACSAYKFFGPHTGIMWGRRELLESIQAYKLRPAPDGLPGKWMTGTQSHESIAGSMAAVDYLADLGRQIRAEDSLTRREALKHAFKGIRRYENELSRQLVEKLTAIPGLKIWGIADLDRIDERFPTFSITINGVRSEDIARQLGERGIFVWHGHYYALQFSEMNDLEPDGMVRIGLVHYNTEEEIERLVAALTEIVSLQSA